MCLREKQKNKRDTSSNNSSLRKFYALYPKDFKFIIN